MPCHIAQWIGPWGLPGQFECDHGFGGGNIGVGNSNHFNMIQCGNAILAHTARANFQPAFQTCLLKIRFRKFVLPKSQVRKRGGRRQDDAKNIKIRRICFYRYRLNSSLSYHSLTHPRHRLHKTVIKINRAFDAMN